MANDCFYAFRTRDTEPAPWLDGSSSLHSTTHTFGCWHKLCGHLVQGSIGDPTQSLAQDMKQESPTAFQGSIRHRGTVRNHFTCLIGFRTTPLWYATSIIQPQRFRTVPQANCPSQKGGIPTILMSASRRGTVQNHSNMLYRIPYHTSWYGTPIPPPKNFRTTSPWYGTPIAPFRSFRTVPRAAPASQKGGISTTPRPLLRCGTVRNQSNGLYRILYHTSVVRNAKTPSKKLPYRTTSSPCIRKRQNSNNLDANISAWYGTEPFQHA